MPLPFFGPKDSDAICRELSAVSGTRWSIERVRFTNLKGDVVSGKFVVTEVLATPRFKEERSPSASAIAALKAKRLLTSAETLSNVGPNTTNAKHIIVVPIERARQYTQTWYNGAAEPEPKFADTIPLNQPEPEPLVVSDGTPAPSAKDFSKYIDALDVLTSEIRFDGHRAHWEAETSDNPGLLIHIDTADAPKLINKLKGVGVNADSYEFDKHTLIIIKCAELESLLGKPATRIAETSAQGRAVDDNERFVAH
jgi:hypothetical protein